jgi:hypothetical protein
MNAFPDERTVERKLFDARNAPEFDAARRRCTKTVARSQGRRFGLRTGRSSRLVGGLSSGDSGWPGDVRAEIIAACVASSLPATRFPKVGIDPMASPEPLC